MNHYPKALVPLAVEQTDSPPTSYRNYARSSFIHLLVEHRILPVFVSPFLLPEMIQELYSDCQGLFLMGGRDIDPSHFGEQRHPELKLAEPKLDALELSVTKQAIEDRKPLLGICRGIQVMAVAQGGSLHQHIPDFSQAIEHSTGKKYDSISSGITHEVQLNPGSCVRRLIGVDTLQVNSEHHQSVKETGRDLRIAGQSEDGVVEFLEHVDPNYFCVGIQAHPELQPDGSCEPLMVAFQEALQVAMSDTNRSRPA